MNDLVDMLARFEEEYNIKVYLVNHDGLIQVDTDVSSIETEMIHLLLQLLQMEK